MLQKSVEACTQEQIGSLFKKNVKDNTRLRTILDGYVVIIPIIIVS